MVLSILRLMLVVSFVPLPALAAGDTALFEVRLVVAAPAAGVEQMSYQSKDGRQVTVYVGQLPLMNLSDVTSASVQTDAQGKTELRVILTPKGRDRLAKTTEEAIHHQLAIVVDGKLLEAPMIQAKLAADYLTVRGAMTAKQAQEMAALINGAIKQR
jgi:preprotein translocase subunit SecD